MPGFDDRLTQALDRAAQPGEPAGVFERLELRRHRRAGVRRIQAALLVVAVLAGTTAGFVALRAAFDPDRTPLGVSPSPTGLPSNGEIVFVREGDDGRLHLFASQPDGTKVRQITHDATNDTDPSVSPGGETIAYSHALRGIQVIATVSFDGGTVAWHTPDDLAANDPAWSPDGDRIAFVGWAEPDVPDGNEAPQRYRAIYTVDATNGPPQRITDGGIPFAADPTWSPDGRSIAFAGGSCTSPCEGAVQSDLYVVDGSTTDVRRLTPMSEGVDEEAPAWSPDGTRIAFTRPGDEGDEVWTIAPDGTDERLVATAVEASLGPDLAWAPDGTALLVSDGDWIYRVDAKPPADPASNFVQLVRGDSPSWQPIPAGAEPSVTASPQPSVSPSPEPVGDDIGFGFAVCEVSHVRAQFDGLGAKDTAYVATRVAVDGMCPSNVEAAEAYVGIDIDEDGLVDESYGPILCEVYYCRAFAAPDLDGDVGRHELLVVESGGSIPDLGVYALGAVSDPTADESGIVRILVGEPDDPDGSFVTGEPVRLALGGDAGWSYRLSCEDRPDGRVLVAASAYREIDSDGPVVVHETTLVYGELTMIVVDVVEREEPPAYDQLGPQPTELCGTPIPPV